MKKSYKDIRKINFFLIMTFIFTPVLIMAKGSPEARIDYVIGRAFLRTTEGKVTQLKKGDHIYHLSEINTEEGSLIGLSNFYDQQFSLAGSGYIKLFQNIMELRAGYLWIESVNSENSKYSVETPNAKVTYKKGISILSYDQYAEKTQILTTQGSFNFMNIFEDHLKISVTTGEFSFISKDYENGMPRKPTPAGQSTFLKITGLFKNRPVETRFAHKDSSYRLVNKKSTPLYGRLPSSNTKNTGGQIIYAHSKKLKYGSKERDLMAISQRNIASLESKLRPKKKKKFKPAYTKKSNVSVEVFGSKTSKKRYSKKKISSMPRKIKAVSKKRAPASINELNNHVEIKRDKFESSLLKEYKNQMRHSKEMNSLINDLNAYDQDYKQSY